MAGRSTWVLDRQPLTLLVAMLTLASRSFSISLIPKGFFPVQDTGMIQAISEASQSISYEAMAKLQNQLAEAILKDPDVASLSSFIGVDGTNQTQNTGRFLINLKPHDERKLTATQIIRRIQQEVSRRRRRRALHAAGAGPDHRRHDQPRALSLRARGRQLRPSSTPGCRSWWSGSRNCRSSPTWRATCSSRGSTLNIVIDRATAARFGITPATVDNALYDAFGQRIISTIYTQSNQYRVIMEVDPSLQNSLDGLSTIYLPSSSSTTNGQVPLSAFVHVEQHTGPLLITHFGQFPATTISFNTAPGVSLGEAVDAIEQAEKRSRPADQLHHRVSGHRGGVPVFAGQRSVADHRRDRRDVYRARRALRELHPPDHDPVDACRRPASARCCR